MLNFYLISVGQTTWDKQGKILGCSDVSLTKHGRDYAVQLAQKLKDKDIHTIITARTTPASQTANIIFKYLNEIPRPKLTKHSYYSLNKKNSLAKIPLLRDAKINSIEMGILQGKFIEEVELRYSDIWQKWQERDKELVFPKGESLKSVHKRIEEFIFSINNHSLINTNYVIITHTEISEIIIQKSNELQDIKFIVM